MLTALPIALSDIAAHRELIEDGASGRLFVAGDVAALAVAILSLLQRPEVAQRLGRRARERALARFSLERAVELHERLYEDVVGCRGGRQHARG
jgi:glycosyltransferase involved in cell wall biosynthesis